MDIERALTIVPAGYLVDAETLAHSERIVRGETSTSETEYETAKARRRSAQPGHAMADADIADVDALADEAAARGTYYISTRRLAELLGVRTLDGFAELGAILAMFRRDRYAPSLVRVRARAPFDQGCWGWNI